MNSFVEWASTSALNAWVLDPAWMWPALETLHFFGLCLLIGGLLVIDLRMLGWLKGLSFMASHRLLPLVILGFGINLVTGILFYFGDPARYSVNIAFQLKMLLVILAGLNALVYFWKIHPVISQGESTMDASLLVKLVGGLSLVSWFGVLIFGRMIPYMGTG